MTTITPRQVPSKDKVDRNTIDRMIRAVLHRHDTTAMRQLADRGQQPVDILAAWLLDQRKPEVDDPRIADGTWRFMLKRCRLLTATDSECSLSRIGATGCLLNWEDPDKQMVRWGKIGQWPELLPNHRNDPSVRLFLGEHGASLGLRPWVLAWMQDPRTQRLITGDWSLEWTLPPCQGDHRIFNALIEAIRCGLVRVPEEQQIPFLLRFGLWARFERQIALEGIIYLEERFSLRHKLQLLSISELQSLAFVYSGAAIELACRKEPLLVSPMQGGASWAAAFRWQLPVARLGDSDLEEGLIQLAAERFNASTCSVERHALFCRYGGVFVKNPDNPFVDPVPLFRVLTGQQEEPQNPTYAEALACLQHQHVWCSQA